MQSERGGGDFNSRPNWRIAMDSDYLKHQQKPKPERVWQFNPLGIVKKFLEKPKIK